MKQALILIDIQNIYFTEGIYHLYCPEKAANNAAKVLEKFRKTNKPIIHIRHMFNGVGYQEEPAFLREFHESVKPLADEIIIEKNYPSAFLETNLRQKLQELEIGELVIAGMMTHMCIDTTTRAAQDYKYSVKVIEDACTTKNLDWHGQQLEAEVVHKSIMASLSGTFAKVLSVDEFCNSEF